MGANWRPPLKKIPKIINASRPFTKLIKIRFLFKPDAHLILLEEPIKALGIYDVPVKITKGLNQEVKVYVIQA